MSKKKILFLTPIVPCGVSSGGVIKTRRIIEELSKDFDVDLFCVGSSDIEQVDIDKFKNSSGLNDVYLSLGARNRNVINLLKSYLNKLPLSVYRNFHSCLKEKINIVAAKYDVIFVDHFIMAIYVDEKYFEKTIFHQHNAEFKMWNSFANIQESKIKKIFLELESRRIMQYEKFYCENFHKTFAAPNDIFQFKQIGVSKEKLLKTYHLGSSIPNDYEKHYFSQTQNQILYVGTLSWQANADGLIWFLESIWPRFKKTNPQTILNIAGKGAPEALIDLVNKTPDVNLLGFVDDLDKLYHESRVFIAPLRFGSGIKVKVVEAMSRGIPVVTTSTGIEGLEISNGEQLFFSDEADSFSQYLSILIDSRDSYWTKMSDSALKYSEAELSWDTVINDIKKVVLSV